MCVATYAEAARAGLVRPCNAWDLFTSSGGLQCGNCLAAYPSAARAALPPRCPERCGDGKACPLEAEPARGGRCWYHAGVAEYRPHAARFEREVLGWRMLTTEPRPAEVYAYAVLCWIAAGAGGGARDVDASAVAAGAGCPVCGCRVRTAAGGCYACPRCPDCGAPRTADCGHR